MLLQEAKLLSYIPFLLYFTINPHHARNSSDVKLLVDCWKERVHTDSSKTDQPSDGISLVDARYLVPVSHLLVLHLTWSLYLTFWFYILLGYLSHLCWCCPLTPPQYPLNFCIFTIKVIHWVCAEPTPGTPLWISLLAEH
jgi:hypothetical protein